VQKRNVQYRRPTRTLIRMPERFVRADPTV